MVTKVEVPTYLNARQVIQRHEALSSFKKNGVEYSHMHIGDWLA